MVKKQSQEALPPMPSFRPLNNTKAINGQ